MDKFHNDRPFSKEKNNPLQSTKRPHSTDNNFRRKPRNKKSKPNEPDQTLSREELEAPKSFIVTRGSVTKKCKQLRDDLRVVFNPYTAIKLKERKKNTLKDFEVAAKAVGVTHLITLTQNDFQGTMLRMIRLPNGPTFWFNVTQYSLLDDIINMTNKKVHYKFSLRFPPLVILNGFSSSTTSLDNENDEQKDQTNKNNEEASKITIPNEVHKTLMAAMFKHMFPPMNVAAMRLNQCKRIVFINYNNKQHNIDVRHYKVKLASINQNIIARRLNKLAKPTLELKRKPKGKFQNQKNKNNDDTIPNLSQYQDISDYIANPNKTSYNGYVTSESEGEENEATHVTLIDNQKNNNTSDSTNKTSETQCAIRLKEIGPRLTLECLKIEELVNTGRVLYHRYVSKTEEEIIALENRIETEKKLKESRKKQQIMNIEKKEEMQKMVKNKRLEKKKQKQVENLLKKFDSDDKVNKKKFIQKRTQQTNENNKPPFKKRKIENMQKKKKVSFQS